MKTMLKGLLTVSALLATSAMAGSMECKVTAQQSSGWGQYCDGMSYTLNNKPTNVTFRIIDLNAPVSQVIWNGGTNCSATSTTCSFALAPYNPRTVRATVLYTNGTYENVEATAMYETGF